MSGLVFSERGKVPLELSALRGRLVPPVRGASAPYIATSDPEFPYALHRIAGYDRQGACALLDLNPETVRRWERDLRRVGARFFGRVVTYEFAARYATDEGLRRAYTALVADATQSVTGEGFPSVPR